ESVEVWELLGARGMRRRLQTARARGLTRFVGRQTEMAALHAALAQARAGHGQVVAVVGEVGVGKSRLVDEFIQAAHSQGWLVLCEDLHWLDTETQALLDSLSESLPTARLLLLVNYRPDYRHGWGSKTYYRQLRLDPLPPASADIFLQALLGDDPSLASLTQFLIQRTEGNPFFLEESVQTLVETGALVGEPGAYRVAQALPTIQMPATVQAVLAARIDRLPPEEKGLLQTAAVMGTEVPLALLQAVEELS